MKLIKYLFTFFLFISINQSAYEAEPFDGNDVQYELAIQMLIDKIEKQNDLLQTQINWSRLFYCWSMLWIILIYDGVSQYEKYVNYRISK